MRGLLVAALCMSLCTAALARDFTIDDQLALQGYGQAVIVPSRDLILIERRESYSGASDFAYDTHFTSRLNTRIMATSLHAPRVLEPLFPQARGAGFWMAGLSPRHTRAAVFRLADRRLSLGIVDLATREVRWLTPVPDMPNASPRPIWLDEDHLVFVAKTRPRLPASLLAGTAGTDELAQLWRAQARGATTRTMITTKEGMVRRGHERRLVLVSLRDQSAQTVMDGDIVDVAVSSDRRHLAIVSAGAPEAAPATPISTAFASRRHRLTLVDLATNRQREVPGVILRGFLAWSRDMRLLAVMRPAQAGWTSARWSQIDVEGRVTPLGGAAMFAPVDASGDTRFVHGGWADRTPVARATDAKGQHQWVRLAPRTAKPLRLGMEATPVGETGHAYLVLDRGRLVAVDATGLRTLARGAVQSGPTLLDPYALGFRRIGNPDVPSMIVCADARPGAVRYVRPIAAGGAVLSPIRVDASAKILAAAGRHALVLTSDERATATISLVDRDGSSQMLDRINEAMRAVDLPVAIDLRTAGRGETRVHDWLILPRRRSPRRPLIVNPYPGLAYGADRPREAGISQAWISDNALILASAGYAVLLPSMPLERPGNPSDALVPRIEAATEAAIATGLVDPARVGLIGHSFGGYAALTVATRSSRFAAVVAANGPTDLIAAHGHMPVADKLRHDIGIPAASSIGWTEAGQGGMALPPSRAGADYLAASPLIHLDRATAPILLITGDLDPVDMSQSERAFMELYRHGKDAQLVRYWGESHTNASPGNIRDYWSTIIAFFDEHLKPSAARITRAAEERSRN